MTLVAISGPSGAGKSTLCEYLQRYLPDSSLLQQDYYFRPPAELDAKDNFCDLNCLYTDQFITDVCTLAKGKTISVPKMNTQTFERINGFETVEPSEFLLVEGMTIFRIPEVFPLFDRRIYLSPGVEEIRKRKVRRDIKERGKTIKDVLYQLSWIEREYQHDLINLSSGVFFISGSYTPKQICDLALKYILE